MSETIKNKQPLIEMEYCFRQYFKENFVPVIEKTSAYLEQNKRKERDAMHGSGIYKFAGKSPVMGGGQKMMDRQLDLNGVWNSKTARDLFVMCHDKFLKDPKVRHDIDTMIADWRYFAIAEIGEDKYVRLSKMMKAELGDASSGDLATDYVLKRIEDLFVDNLAKRNMPKDSIDYVLKKGVGDSLLGTFLAWDNRNKGVLNDRVKERSEKFYSSSASEKCLGNAVSVVIDGVTIPVGGAAKGVAWAATDFAGRTALPAAKKGCEKIAKVFGKDVSFTDQTYDQYLSAAMFGDATVLDSFQAAGRKVKPQTAYYVSAENASLNKKMKIAEYSPPYSPSETKVLAADIRSKVKEDADVMESSVKTTFDKLGIKYNAKAEPPTLMTGKNDESGCIMRCCNLFAIAVQMAQKNKKELTIDGRKMTIEQVAQKAYDFSRAAKIQKENRLALAAALPSEQVKHQPEPQTDTSSNINSTPYAAHYQQMPAPNPYQQVSQPTPSTAGQPLPTSGWNGLVDMLGLSGMSDIGRNFGYVMAMLPDMLVGMFTGKSRNLQFKDNLFPIAAILAGLFVKNPMLKLLLICLGGANMLNKAGHEALENAGVKQPARQYKKYTDEPLDCRLRDIGMKGNTMLATIDGVPGVFTLSDNAADAYYKGVLPLNTLANAVLRSYDTQKADIASGYEQGLSDKESKHMNTGIR